MKAPKWFIEKIKQIDPALDIIKGRWGYWHLVKNIDTPGRKNYYKEDKSLWDVPKYALKYIGVFHGKPLYKLVKRTIHIGKLQDARGYPIEPCQRIVDLLREADCWNRERELKQKNEEYWDKQNKEIQKTEQEIEDFKKDFVKTVKKMENPTIILGD